MYSIIFKKDTPQYVINGILGSIAQNGILEYNIENAGVFTSIVCGTKGKEVYLEKIDELQTLSKTTAAQKPTSTPATSNEITDLQNKNADLQVKLQEALQNVNVNFDVKEGTRVTQDGKEYQVTGIALRSVNDNGEVAKQGHAKVVTFDEIGTVYQIKQ